MEPILELRVMPVNMSVKNVPDEVAEKLRARAKRNHRSLQGELLVILEEAADHGHREEPMVVLEEMAPGRLTVEEADRRIKALGIRTPDESTQWIREMRDARYGG